jgi:hypothetical protein
VVLPFDVVDLDADVGDELVEAEAAAVRPDVLGQTCLASRSVSSTIGGR